MDNGLLRKDEFNEVMVNYKNSELNVKGIDASDLFYKNLKNITDAEEKRKVIGKLFIDVFKEQIQKYNASFLGQGTNHTSPRGI